MPDSATTPLSKNEQERLARLKDARGRKIKRVLLWLLVLAIIAAGTYGLIHLSRKQTENKPGEAIPELSREHVVAGSKVEVYNSNPPTSGPHYPEPAQWGAYDAPLPDEQVVHNLEHGGIWISYRDTQDAELISQLKSIVDDFSLKVILTPRAQNDSRIAVAAWTRLLKLDQFDETQIRDFIGAFINRGPEQVPY